MGQSNKESVLRKCYNCNHFEINEHVRYLVGACHLCKHPSFKDEGEPLITREDSIVCPLGIGVPVFTSSIQAVDDF
jgi:hypothetical protein